MFSQRASRILMGIGFVVTARKEVSEAFLTIGNINRSKLFSEISTSKLSFNPRNVEESDFRTPAESFTFTRYAKATITSEYVKSEWKDDDNYSTRLSYLDIISSTASASNSPDLNEDIVELNGSDEPLAQAHRIQQAYREWCEFYGKETNKERLGIFASNFLAVEEFHAKTGRPLVLNEFADLTEEQYRHNHQSPVDEKSESTEKILVEDNIREAYRQWCEYYDRSYDEKRLRTFAANYLAVEKYHLRTKMSLVLNEFADMIEREYKDYMATAAHFTTPENIGPRANDDSPSVEKPNETIMPAIDPITSYLDPDPSPTSYSCIDVLKPPLPKSEVGIVESNKDISVSSEATDSFDALTATNAVIATLQNTVASLSATVESLVKASQSVAPQPTAEPLDTLVIDLLQQQDGSISQLEESVEGLHEIQKQSSELIELVSNNQKQMTEMMESVHFEFAALQQDQQQVEENYSLLLSRIKELEAVVAQFDSDDPVLKKSLVLSPERKVELKPNIFPVGLAMPCINP